MEVHLLIYTVDLNLTVENDIVCKFIEKLFNPTSGKGFESKRKLLDVKLGVNFGMT